MTNSCSVSGTTIPLGFEPGLIAHSESRASVLPNSAKGSDPLGRCYCRPVGLLHSSLPQWCQAPLSVKMPFSPGQKVDNQSAVSELSMRWVLPRPAVEPSVWRLGNNPTRFRTWVDSTLRVVSQCSTQFDQKLRPVSERLAGWVGFHTPMNNRK